MRQSPRAAGHWAADHPVLVAALVGALAALVSGWHIWHLRTAGTYDPDESGYLMAALRYQRSIDPGVPLALGREVMRTTTAPLVPLLSLPFLILGPRDPRAAMMVQPLFLWLVVVGVAWIVQRLSRPWLAILAAVYVASLPTIISASETFWFGLGAAAAMVGAVAALLASDGLANRWRWAFGLAVAAMVLSRTMTIAFVPSLLIAGLFLAWGDRRRLRGLAEALLVGLAVAAPWYVLRRNDVFSYLVDYGYGERSEGWGAGDLASRLALRAGRLFDSLVFPGPIALVLLAVLVNGALVARRRGWNARSLSPRAREAVALASIPLTGTIALLTSQNEGVWFELPIVVIAACVIAVGVQVAQPLLRGAVVAIMVGVIVVTPFALRLQNADELARGFTDYDLRFEMNGSPESDQAVEEWHEVNRKLEATLAEITDDGRRGSVTMSGNMFMVNTNSVGLLAEENLWYLRAHVPDTFGAPGRYEADLTPETGEVTESGEQKERVIVIVRHDLIRFTPDLEWEDFEAAATAAGWEVVEQIDLPSDGDIVILRHRDADTSPDKGS